MAEKGAAGEVYNICSGKPVKIGDLMDLIVKVSGADVTCQTDPALLRPEGPNRRFGSSAKLQSLGWETRFALEDSIRDMWEYLENHGGAQES